MTKQAVIRERKRLEALLERAGVPEVKRDTIAPVVDNIAFMRLKLDETRNLILDECVVSRYNNGGGQEGQHESPLFKAYLNLWKGYLAGLDKFVSYLPKEMQEEAAGDVLNILEQVKQMKKVGA